jgi:large repetitive protein
MSLFPRSTVVAFAFAALTLAGPARAGLGVGPTSPIDPVRFPAVRDQDQVAAADNGSVTLYAWRDTRRGGGDIFGARVRHDGTVLDPNGIELAGGSGDESEPALSWDGTQWLLAWTDAGEVKIQRVSASGALPDIPTTISTGGSTASHPALAWNGAVHIAAWAELAAGNSQVFAASIDDNGSVLAAGAALSLGTSDAAPAIAALGANALVTFNAGAPGSEDIHGVRVTAALPLGAIVRLDAADLVIVAEANGQTASAVAASNSGWLVAWEDARNANAIDIRGTRVNAGGAVLDGTSILVSGESGASGVALTHDGSQWLASWKGGSDSVGQKLRALANNGNPGNTTVVVSATVGRGDGAFGGEDANPTIAWSDAAGSEQDLLGRRIGAALALDPAFPIATQTPNQTEPSHAFGAGHWMIAWVDDRFGSDQRQIRVGLTDSARFEPPNPTTVTFAVPRVGLDQGHPSLIYDGTNFNLFWDEERGGRRMVCGARFTAGGGPIDTFTVAGGAWNQY